MRFYGRESTEDLVTATRTESTYQPNVIPTSTVREVPATREARIGVLRRLGYELSDFDLWDGWLILEESSAEVIIRYLIPPVATNLATRFCNPGG
jgi:hypothetical protein